MRSGHTIMLFGVLLLGSASAQGQFFDGLMDKIGGFASFQDKVGEKITQFSLQKQLEDALAEDPSRASTPSQLITESGGIEVEDCGDSSHALQFDHGTVDPESLTLHTHGTLLREVKGGIVSATVYHTGEDLVTQVFASLLQDMDTTEPLCEHMGRQTQASQTGPTCPIQAGPAELLFSFKRLPRAVLAGKYTLEVRATDEEGNPVSCVRGHMQVQKSKDGAMVRRLEECGQGHLCQDAANDCCTCTDQGDTYAMCSEGYYPMAISDGGLSDDGYMNCYSDWGRCSYSCCPNAVASISSALQISWAFFAVAVAALARP